MSSLRLPAERLRAAAPGGGPAHDGLTGLPNRALLLDRLHQAIARADRTRCQVAALVLDLDDFAGINERHGRAAGDQLLRHVAALLRTCVRGSDTAARTGGDVFTVLLADVGARDDVSARAEHIRRRVAAPCLWQGHVLRASASLGLAVYPRDIARPELLLHLADAAMFQAKVRRRPAATAPPATAGSP